MKKTNLLFGLKPFTLLIGLFLIIGLASSCEKDELEPDTCSHDGVMTESFSIHKDVFKRVDNYWEALLPSFFYDNSANFEYVKVFEKVAEQGSLEEMWDELPTSKTYYDVVANKIYVQKYTEPTKDRYEFLVEMKKKEE